MSNYDNDQSLYLSTYFLTMTFTAIAKMATIQELRAMLWRYFLEAEEEVELENSYSNLQEYSRMIVITMMKKIVMTRRMEKHREMSRREKMLLMVMIMMIRKYSTK